MLRDATTEADAGAPPTWEVLGRYLAGESPAGEVESVRAWLARHPDDEALVTALDGVAAAASPGRVDEGIDVDTAWRRVAERRREGSLHVVEGGARSAPSPAAPGGRRWTATALRAAAIAGVAAAGTLVWQATRGAGVSPAAPQRVATDVGARDSVRLPDGSQVVLAPRSELVVPAGFGRDARQVELRGEAYFEVVHDESRPFTVRAGGAEVRDVGTSFTVRHVDGGPVRVVVSEGVVRLGARGGDGVTLERGDVGVLGVDGRASVERGVATADDVAWTEGRLVFRGASLDEVGAELSRWYGVELRVQDSAVAGRHLTATFAGEPADSVLRAIALSLGARLERRGDTAFVRALAGPGSTTTRSPP